MKQKAFVEAVLDSSKGSLRKAYEAVYGTGGKQTTRQTEASRLWASAPCREWADEVRARLVRDRSRRLAGVRDRVHDRLERIADDPEARDSDRIQALKLIGSMAGVSMWVDQVQHSSAEVASDAEVVAEIAAALESAARPNSPTVPGVVSAPGDPAPEVGEDPTVH